jgi:hypothetical protein
MDLYLHNISTCSSLRSTLAVSFFMQNPPRVLIWIDESLLQKGNAISNYLHSGSRRQKAGGSRRRDEGNRVGNLRDSADERTACPAAAQQQQTKRGARGALLQRKGRASRGFLFNCARPFPNQFTSTSVNRDIIKIHEKRFVKHILNV